MTDTSNTAQARSWSDTFADYVITPITSVTSPFLELTAPLGGPITAGILAYTAGPAAINGIGNIFNAIGGGVGAIAGGVAARAPLVATAIGDSFTAIAGGIAARAPFVVGAAAHLFTVPAGWIAGAAAYVPAMAGAAGAAVTVAGTIITYTAAASIAVVGITVSLMTARTLYEDFYAHYDKADPLKATKALWTDLGTASYKGYEAVKQVMSDSYNGVKIIGHDLKSVFVTSNVSSTSEEGSTSEEDKKSTEKMVDDIKAAIISKNEAIKQKLANTAKLEADFNSIKNLRFFYDEEYKQKLHGMQDKLTLLSSKAEAYFKLEGFICELPQQSAIGQSIFKQLYVDSIEQSNVEVTDENKAHYKIASDGAGAASVTLLNEAKKLLDKVVLACANDSYYMEIKTWFNTLNDAEKLEFSTQKDQLCSDTGALHDQPICSHMFDF